MEAHVDRRYNCIVDKARALLFALRANVESWRALTKKFTEGNRWKPVSPSSLLLFRIRFSPSFFPFSLSPLVSSFSSFNRHKSSLPNRISQPSSSGFRTAFWAAARNIHDFVVAARPGSPYESREYSREYRYEKVENLYRWSSSFAAGFIADGRWRGDDRGKRIYRRDFEATSRYGGGGAYIRMLFRVPRNRNPRQIVDEIVSTKLNRLAGWLVVVCRRMCDDWFYCGE